MSYVFDQNDVIALAHGIGAETKQKGRELFFKYCPYCHGGDNGHDKETFSVNLESGVFKCFRSTCDRHGHFVELARDMNFPLDFGYAPRKYKKLEQKEIKVRDEAVEYMASRGLSEEVTRRYSITVRSDMKNVLVFPFYDEYGVMVSAKYRKTDFDKNRDKNKEWFEKNTKPVLFGMKQCKDFTRLIITEGQLDSLTVSDCGISNAVSVPTGASGFTWIDNCFDWVHKFEELIIFGDCEKDKITLVDGISQRFPDKKIKVVRREDYLGEKDANDILRKYGKDAVIKCVENAAIKPVTAVKKLSDVRKVDLEKLEHIKTGIWDVDKAIRGLYFGQVALLTGKRGEGKSTLASQICANALEQGYSIFAYSGELPDYHFKNWIDLQLAGTQRIKKYTNDYGEESYYLDDDTVARINAWYDERAYIFDNSAVDIEVPANDNTGNKITLLGAIEQAVCRYGIKFVLIDNLMTALDVEPDSNLYQSQSCFIKKVKRLATRLEIAVLIVAHPRKESDGKELDSDSVSGSSDITNAVDIVMTYSANTGEDKEVYQSLIGIPKNRLTGKKLVRDGRVKVRYGAISKRIVCASDDPQKIYSCFTADIPNDLPEEPPF